MESSMSANAWFPTRGRPKTTVSIETEAGSAMRSIVASSVATAAPSEWPTNRTKVSVQHVG